MLQQKRREHDKETAMREFLHRQYSDYTGNLHYACGECCILIILLRTRENTSKNIHAHVHILFIP